MSVVAAMNGAIRLLVLEQALLSASAQASAVQDRRAMSIEKHVFVVFTNAVEGQENIYNEWYTDVHLKDVLKVLASSQHSGSR